MCSGNFRKTFVPCWVSMSSENLQCECHNIHIFFLLHLCKIGNLLSTSRKSVKGIITQHLVNHIHILNLKYNGFYNFSLIILEVVQGYEVALDIILNYFITDIVFTNKYSIMNAFTAVIFQGFFFIFLWISCGYMVLYCM